MASHCFLGSCAFPKDLKETLTNLGMCSREQDGWGSRIIPGARTRGEAGVEEGRGREARRAVCKFVKVVPGAGLANFPWGTVVWAGDASWAAHPAEWLARDGCLKNGSSNIHISLGTQRSDQFWRSQMGWWVAIRRLCIIKVFDSTMSFRQKRFWRWVRTPGTLERK